MRDRPTASTATTRGLVRVHLPPLGVAYLQPEQATAFAYELLVAAGVPVSLEQRSLDELRGELERLRRQVEYECEEPCGMCAACIAAEAETMEKPMSEPVVSTGRKHVQPCHLCGVDVEHEEVRGLYGGKSWWLGTQHDAPCGIRCFSGGGARGPDGLARYKAGQLHGLGTGRPCPACGEERDRLLILDLDGTVRECTVEGQPCPNGPGEQRLIPAAVYGIRRHLEQGGLLAFATNQGGPAAGYGTRAGVQSAIDETVELLISHPEHGEAIREALDGTKRFRAYACFHAAKAGCSCRKPGPRMLLDAMKDFGTKPSETRFIGDRDTDRQAAEAAGCLWTHADEWHATWRPYVEDDLVF